MPSGTLGASVPAADKLRQVRAIEAQVGGRFTELTGYSKCPGGFVISPPFPRAAIPPRLQPWIFRPEISWNMCRGAVPTRTPTRRRTQTIDIIKQCVFTRLLFHRCPCPPRRSCPKPCRPRLSHEAYRIAGGIAG